MSEISRRKFIGSTATSLLLAQTVGSVAKGELIAAPVRGLADRRLRVQFSPGGHTAPLQIYAMFEDPLFAEFESVVRAHPYAMDTVDDVDYPDIIVTNVCQNFPDLIQWRRFGLQQKLCCVSVAQDRAKRLVNLVRDQRGQLT